MIIAAHTAVGGLLGRVINPDTGKGWVLTILLAAGSHIPLDFLPQIGYTFTPTLRLLDLLAAVLILVIMVRIATSKKSILLAGIAAAAPDIEHFLVEYTEPVNRRIFISHLESFPRIELSWQWGLIVESGVILLAIAGVYFLESLVKDRSSIS